MNNFNPNSRGELCTAEQAGQLLDEIIRVVKATERAPVEGEWNNLRLQQNMAGLEVGYFL
jgi:hypothetical protein